MPDLKPDGHTPLPWKLFAGENCWSIVPVDDAGRPRNGAHTEHICSGPENDDALANSALIMRAVAHYAELVAFVRDVAGGMGNLPLSEIGPAGVHGPNDGKARAIYLERFVASARALLFMTEE